jgi:fructose-1,6-bisphosphatase/inositol monophosphatase family enzyme
VYRQDASKGSPALSLAAAARFVNNVVVTRGDDPFQPVAGGSVAPWDTLAGMFIYQKAGGEFSSLADRHGNVQVGTGNLSICVMGPSWELADRVAVALRNAAKS